MFYIYLCFVLCFITGYLVHLVITLDNELYDKYNEENYCNNLNNSSENLDNSSSFQIINLKKKQH